MQKKTAASVFGLQTPALLGSLDGVSVVRRREHPEDVIFLDRVRFLRIWCPVWVGL